jgi:hypothetical protein
MARKKGDFLSGVLGPLVFRVVNGVQRVSQRPEPGTMKQTADTKRAANTFGMASSLGAKFRGTLKEQLLAFSNNGVKNRLNGRLMEILGSCRNPKSLMYQFAGDSFEGLEDFEYHTKSTVGKLLGRPPEISVDQGKIRFRLPELKIPIQLKFPYDSFRCKINVSVSLLRLRDGLYQALAETQTVVFNNHMKKTDPHEFEFEVPNGCLCIVSLFLVYETANRKGWKMINNKNFNPGCICKAIITDGEYQAGDGIIWKEMVKFP